MGRCRAKAKQTKVARELKYSTGGTDLDRLRAELIGGPQAESNPAADDDEEDDDPYARYVSDDEDDEDSYEDKRRSG